MLVLNSLLLMLVLSSEISKLQIRYPNQTFVLQLEMYKNEFILQLHIAKNLLFSENLALNNPLFLNLP